MCGVVRQRCRSPQAPGRSPIGQGKATLAQRGIMDCQCWGRKKKGPPITGSPFAVYVLLVYISEVLRPKTLLRSRYASTPAPSAAKDPTIAPHTAGEVFKWLEADRILSLNKGRLVLPRHR